MPELHRDDIPFEVAEEIERALKELHPGFRVTCAGDIPEDQRPDDLKAAMAAIEARHRDSFLNGTCITCGKKMPGVWPPAGENAATWRPPHGWGVIYDMGDNPMAFECDECDGDDDEIDMEDLEGRE